MNIGIVTAWYPAGGGYVSRAYREILAKDHKVLIYARGGKVMKGDEWWDDEYVTWGPLHFNGTNTRHLINWAKSEKIDVLFFNEQRFWKPVITAKRAGICIGTYVDYYTQATVPAFKLYDFLVCNTVRHFSVFEWHPDANFVPWGTDIEKFSPVNQVPERPLTFIISAGWQGTIYRDRRGSLLALKAFQNVKGNCKLVVYSQVKLSDCLPEWQELISSDSRIEFRYGTVEPFPFNDGDVYLYPSRLDGIGLSLPEAISSGLASITTDNAPMNEFVKNNVNGKLIKVDKFLGREDGYYWAESICDLDSLTNAMQSYLEDPLLLNEHKMNARKLAIKKLDWKKNAHGLSDIFSEAFNNTKEIDQATSELAIKLDKKMAPSVGYKIFSIVKAYLYFLMKKGK